jgi:hypothetical protein
MPKYEAAWLRRAEVFWLFENSGFVELDIQTWLTRAIEDRGIVCDRQSSAATDLFRLDRVVQAHQVASWVPDLTTLNWTDFTIDAPDIVRRIRTQATVEVSAALLRSLLQRVPPQSQRAKRGKRPTKRAAVVARMREDIAAGRRNEAEIQGMKEVALAEIYEVSRDTVRSAREELLAKSE